MRNAKWIFLSNMIATTTLSTGFSIQNVNKSEPVIKKRIDYSFSASYYKSSSDQSDVYQFLKWKDYAKDWREFTTKFQNFKLKGQLYSAIVTEGDHRLILNDAVYRTEGIEESWENSFLISSPYFISATHYTMLNLHLWRIDDDFYFKWQGFFKGDATNHITIQVNSITFFA